MHLAQADRWIWQMFQHFGHHHDIETRVLKIDRESEIHFRAGKSGRARFIQRRGVDVDADPIHHIDDLHEQTGATTEIQSAAFAIVPKFFERAAKKSALDLFVLPAAGAVSSGLVILLIKFLNKTPAAIRFAQQQFFGKSRFRFHFPTNPRRRAALTRSKIELSERFQSA